MHNFDALKEEEKVAYHKTLLRYSDNFGGKNFFLTFLESIRETKPHLLTASNSKFTVEFGTVSWNKVIYPKTLDVLLKARIHEGKQDNFLPNVNESNYKKVLNVVRTLKPIVFYVKPSHIQEGNEFFFQAFNVIDDKTTKLNPVFDALFFSPIESVKKVLNYKPRTA